MQTFKVSCTPPQKPPLRKMSPQTHHASKHRKELQATNTVNVPSNCWVFIIAFSDLAGEKYGHFIKRIKNRLF
jgi:hypothetical protein